MRRVLLAAAVLACTPAVAADYSYQPVSDRSLQTVQRPAVGFEAEAELGQSLIDDGRSARGIDVIEPSSAKLGLRSFPVRAGRYGMVAENSEGVFYRALPPVRGKDIGMSILVSEVGLFVPTDPVFPPMQYARLSTGGVAVSKPIVGLNYRATGAFAVPGGLRRELLYGGAAKGVIKVSYREFSNDMARPAFTQDLTYDLADGAEIGFRGARIKILKATNTAIKYVVLKPLSE